MSPKKLKMHFMDIDAAFDAKGVIMRRNEILVVVRSNSSSNAPALKEFRYPTHLLKLLKDAPNRMFIGQPAGTEALAVLQANVSGGGLLIVSFGNVSAFDKSTTEQRHTELTVY